MNDKLATVNILIPTFNRAKDLEKNLILLDSMVEKEKVIDFYQVIVSDNNSSDGTREVVEKLKNTLKLKIIYHIQKENVGLENNSIFLLTQANADYAMYVGDDDFLPEGYLRYIANKIIDDKDTTAIVPGFSGLFANGNITPARSAKFNEKKYQGKLTSVLLISNFGHQLSGIVFKRSLVYQEYTKIEKYRNIYPFIFFLSYNILRGNSYYAPKFQILVSQSNTKDWSYDDSGLLTEIFRNYSILFPGNIIKQSMCNIVFILKQSWRLRIEKNYKTAWLSYVHLTKSEHVNFLTKLSLPLIYLYLYLRILAKMLISNLIPK